MNTALSFKFAIILILMVVVSIALGRILDLLNLDGLSIFTTVLLFGAVCIGMIGSVFAIKSFREETTIRKVFAMMVHFGVVAVFFLIVIVASMDIFRIFIK